MLARTLFIVFAVCAWSASAKPIVPHDFDGDGHSETIQLVQGHNEHQHLLIESATLGTIFSAQIAANDSMAAQTSLVTLPHGSVQIEHANLGIGRYKWIFTITLAFRNNAIRIAGLTYVRFDSLNPDNNARCDLNLLTGQGDITINGNPADTFLSKIEAPKLSDWSSLRDFWQSDLFPSVCFD